MWSVWWVTVKGHNQNLHIQCQIFTLSYLCSHYTAKTYSLSVEWESRLAKSSLLTCVPLGERLANKLSAVNYALIQVPLRCVSVWIHLHMSRCMPAYEHVYLLSLYFSFIHWYRKGNDGHVTAQIPRVTSSVQAWVYLLFSSLFNHFSKEALSLIPASKTPTHLVQNKSRLACACACVEQALIKCLSHHYFV